MSAWYTASVTQEEAGYRTWTVTDDNGSVYGKVYAMSDGSYHSSVDDQQFDHLLDAALLLVEQA